VINVKAFSNIATTARAIGDQLRSSVIATVFPATTLKAGRVAC
jgi:hypothetical protein